MGIEAGFVTGVRKRPGAGERRRLETVTPLGGRVNVSWRQTAANVKERRKTRGFSTNFLMP